MTELIHFENRDCVEAMKEFPDKFFDLAIVDPPYGVKYSRGKNGFGICENRPNREATYWDVAPDKEYFDELIRVSKNQIVFGGNYFTEYLPSSKCWIVWDKICEMQNKGVFADCELAWTSFTKVCKMFKFRQFGFIHDTKDKKRIHPTQKPTELYKWILEHYAKDGDKILDTHVGSASSLIACARKGFEVWGYEIDKEYYKNATERIENELAQESLF